MRANSSVRCERTCVLKEQIRTLQLGQRTGPATENARGMPGAKSWFMIRSAFCVWSKHSLKHIDHWKDEYIYIYTYVYTCWFLRACVCSVKCSVFILIHVGTLYIYTQICTLFNTRRCAHPECMIAYESWSLFIGLYDYLSLWVFIFIFFEKRLYVLNIWRVRRG